MLRAHQVSLFQHQAPGMDLAGDPNARPEALAELAEAFHAQPGIFPGEEASYYLAAREAALHPNTPAAALLALAYYFPWQVSLNPALELTLVMGEVALDSLSSDSSLYLLAPTRNISAGLYETLERLWLSSIRSLPAAMRLAQHPDTSPELLAAAHQGARNTVVPNAGDAFTYHRNNPDQPAYAAPYTRTDALRAVRNNYNGLYDALAYLAAGELISLEVIEEFELRGEAPSDWLHKYIGATVRLHHPRTDPLERERARGHLQTSDLRINTDRWRRPDVHPEGLAHLVALRAHAVQPLLALSGGQPDEITKTLLIHHNPAVRAALALSGNLPEWAHQALLDDANARVRATAQAMETA